MSIPASIQAFLDGTPHAVVGASRNRAKYGNKVLRAYMQTDRRVYPVTPNAEEIEGLAAYPDLASLPEPIHGISIVVPPTITLAVIEQAGQLGVQHVWMQPGAENDAAVERANLLGMNVIAGGPCLLVALQYHE